MHIGKAKLLIVIVLSFILTLLINSGIFENNIFKIMNMEEFSYSVEDFDIQGYEKRDDVYYSINKAPRLIKKNLNKYIGSLHIKFSDSVEEDIKVAITYSINGEEYNEKQVIYSNIDAGSQDLLINMNKTIKNIRIHIGDKEGIKISLSQITFNEGVNHELNEQLIIVIIICISIFIILYTLAKRFFEHRNLLINYIFEREILVCADILFGIILLFIKFTNNQFIFEGINIHILIKIYLLINILYLLIDYILLSKNPIFNKIYKYRYVITVILFIISVFVFKINFSSMQSYYETIPNNIAEVKNIEIGKYRSIRSDEWMVLTPLQLSQQYNNNNINSDLLGESVNALAISGGLPTKDLTIFAKPFLWGYMLFGNEIGFSWYNISKLFLFLMFSYKMLYIFVKNKKLSLMGSMIITISPGIQWWLSTNSLACETIIYFEMIIVSLYNIFNDSKLKNKYINAVLLFIATVGFTFVFYPPNQIPLFYFGIALLTGLYFSNKENISFSKKNFIILGIVFIGYVLTTSITVYGMLSDIIKIINTEYPGKRFVTGGGLTLEKVFNYIPTMLLPFENVNYSNSSEVSSFITFFPIPILMYFTNMKKFNDNVIKSIIIFLLLALIFMYVGIPSFLAKITLLSYVTEVRVNMVFGFASTILVIIMAGKIRENMEYEKNKMVNTIIIILYSVIIILIYSKNTNMQSYVDKSIFIAILSVLLIMVYYLNINRNIFINLMLITTIFVGGTINPINFGIEELTETRLSKEINEINTNNPGVWATIDDIYLSKYIIAQGIKEINALNYPPRLSTWQKLDVDKKFANIYNRYAHVKISLKKDTDKKFELVSNDVFQLNTSILELRKLGVDYILSREKITYIDDLNYVELMYIDKKDSIYIYRVK